MSLSNTSLNPLITIIIPNWNGKKFLQECLNSLKSQTFKNFTITLVDDGSFDGSIHYLHKYFPEISIIDHKKHLGFSAAVNSGIKASSHEFIALLNNDVAVDRFWLESLYQALKNNPHVGFCASNILNYYHRDKVDSAGDIYTVWGRPQQRGHWEKAQKYNKEEEIFGACAAGALYRRKLFLDIGLFDEDFYANCEDVDIDFRAQLKGYKCLFVPSAIIYHIAGGTYSTSKRKSSKQIFLAARNNLNVIVKNISGKLLLKYLLYIVYGNLLWFIKESCRGHLFACLCGYLSFIFQLPRMLKKRQKIQITKRASDNYINSLLLQGTKYMNLNPLYIYKYIFRIISRH